MAEVEEDNVSRWTYVTDGIRFEFVRTGWPVILVSDAAKPRTEVTERIPVPEWPQWVDHDDFRRACNRWLYGREDRP